MGWRMRSRGLCQFCPIELCVVVSLPRSLHYVGPALAKTERRKMPAHFGRDDRKNGVALQRRVGAGWAAVRA
jgi:hypothetical protein